VVPKGSGSDVKDTEMRRRNPCLPGVPLAAVAELGELADFVGRAAPGVAAPALVVAGGQDHTVTLAGARRLARRLGGGPAEVLVLPESWHLVGIDVERERCADAAVEFLAGLPVPGARKGAAPRRRPPRTGGGAIRGARREAGRPGPARGREED